ncbi:MAG: diaminopimelate epimerase [Pirellulaceae bacterium]|nr:diaminopimelate epimerase [Pirellulaceae bacterium]HJN12896.1 diaminopimelate epimerase [Pirellulaceae bacterium]
MQFTKMHGAGNDYLYIDCFDGNLPADASELSRQMSHRRFGVGADGLILIRKSDHADARMQMFNADGSEAEMCGNGIRCVAKYVYDHGLCRQSNLKIETACGVLSLDLETNGGVVTRVRTDMGEPILQADQIPTTLPGDPVIDRDLDVAGEHLAVTCVSMGNPHCIVFVEQATDALVLETGPRIETHEAFPEKVNVEFIEVISPQEVRQRTWERGSGETWACGTGASAVCVAGVLSGRTERKILNHLLGGCLELEWDEATNHVFMTGPATEVFTGNWPT